MLAGFVTGLRFCLTVGAIIMGAISMVCAAASLGGAWSARLDIFSHFALVWAGLGVASLALSLASGSRVGGTLGLIGLVLASVLIVPEVLSASQTPQTTVTHPTLKVVQFNLWGRNRDQAATAQWIISQNADILVLEEAFGGTEHILASLRQSYPYVTTCRRSPCSTVVMSRQRPIASGDMMRLPGEVHLSGAWATFASVRGPFTIVGAHFTWPIPAGPQRSQRRVMVRSAARFPRDRLIIAGDFNSAPWSFGLRRLDHALGIERYSRALPSWPAARYSRWNLWSPFPFMPIDHVYAGSSWRQVSVARGPRLGSDHYPLVVLLNDSAPET